MSARKHHKHPILTRSNKGEYHRCEWAIYGTSCGNILSYFNHLEETIKELVLIDADHTSGLKDFHFRNKEKQLIKTEALEINSFDERLQELQCKAVFVNGNHYPAIRQVVIIDEKKKDSLFRRKEQLTQIDLVIVNESEDEIFDFVADKMNEHTLVFNTSQFDEQLAFFKDQIALSIPPIKAVVLAGGKSQRMGQDKSALIYHENKPQQLYLAEMCQELGYDTYLSKSHDEQQTELGGFNIIKDRFVDLGPQGAILSAMMTDPNAAWLVIACDLPLVNKALIQQLINARDYVRFATAFKTNEESFPEPLITIYEPKSYQRMLGFLSLGYSCPRKVLINSVIKEIVLDDKQLVSNANTPDERDRLLVEINADG